VPTIVKNKKSVQGGCVPEGGGGWRAGKKQGIRGESKKRHMKRRLDRKMWTFPGSSATKKKGKEGGIDPAIVLWRDQKNVNGGPRSKAPLVGGAREETTREARIT